MENVYSEFRGQGKIIYQDNREYWVNFEVYHLTSGGTIGSFLFTKYDMDIERRFDGAFTFDFVGVTEDNLKIQSEGCVMISLQQFKPIQGFNAYTSHYLLNDIKIYDERLLTTIGNRNNLTVEFGINDFYDNSKISLNTEIGSVQVYSIIPEEKSVLNRYTHEPYISSNVTITLIENTRALDKIKDECTNLVSKLLDLCSLAKLTLIQWTYFKIYVHHEAKLEFVYSEIRALLPRIPNVHELIPSADLQDFLATSYGNYDFTMNDRFNFSLALKWFLESISLKPDIMNFISASTSFECILDRYHPDYHQRIIAKEVFKDVRASLEEILRKELKNKKVEQSEIDLISYGLGNINRRSYKWKGTKLLSDLNILTDQRKTEWDNIVELRNTITHTGWLPAEKRAEVIKGYLNHRFVSCSFHEVSQLWREI